MDIKVYENKYTHEFVNAIKLTADNVEKLAMWCDGNSVIETDPTDTANKYVGINVPTELGMVRASEGDYIVQRSLSIFYTLKPIAFENAFGRANQIDAL
jgi:hypothetical protein